MASRTKWTVAIVSLVSLVLLVLLMSWLRPGVPKEVTIFTGLEGSRSYEYAQRYAEYVEAHRIRADIVATAGSGEILDRFIRIKRPAVGFLQSGVEHVLGDQKAPDGLQSLGSLYFQPTFAFVRTDSHIHDAPDLEGKRVFSGQPGSDAQATVHALLDAFGIDRPPPDPALDRLSPAQAADALLAGEIDAVFIAGELGWDSVMRLLEDESIRLLSAKHADVFTRIHPEVGSLLIPQGLFDLGKMLPRQEKQLIAPAVILVADESLHPALVDLFLDAATRIHRRGTILSKRGEFPSDHYTSLPMNPDALRYYKQGPSGLRKYLPFWVASLIDELIVYGLPFFVVLSSVFKGIPLFLEWKTKLDFMKIYKQIQVVENASDHEAKREEYLTELDRIEAECARFRVPRIHLSQYFELRQYIHDLRGRLERAS